MQTKRMLLSIVSAMLATALLSAGPVWAQDPGGGGADPGGAEPAGEEPMDAEPMDEEPADESADDDSGAEAASGERQSKNSIYAEGLGHGFWYSINYDRIIVDQIAARVGFGYVSFSAAAGSTEASAGILYVPITASWVGLYSGSHGLETGAGATIIYATAAVSSAGTNAEGSGVGAVGTAHVGYRLQPVDYGFNFRIGLMTIFGPGVHFSVDPGDDPTSFGAIPWGYLSLGGSF